MCIDLRGFYTKVTCHSQTIDHLLRKRHLPDHREWPHRGGQEYSQQKADGVEHLMTAAYTGSAGAARMAAWTGIIAMVAPDRTGKSVWLPSWGPS